MAVKEATSPIAISARLGELLVSEGLVTYEQLNECMELQKKDGRILSSIIAEKGYQAQEKLVELVFVKCGYNLLRLNERGAMKKDIVKMVPEKIARQKLILPIEF